MSKTLQNIVFLSEPSEPWVISIKGADMCLNRLCIDEDAAFEFSGVHYSKQSSREMYWDAKYKLQRTIKGKALSAKKCKFFGPFW